VNRVYRIVFNGHLGIPQVASELACGGVSGHAGAPLRPRRAKHAGRAIAMAIAAALAVTHGAAVWATTVTGAAGGDGATGTARNVPVGNWGNGGDGGSAASQPGAPVPASGGAGGVGGNPADSGWGSPGSAGSNGSGGGGGGASYAVNHAGGAGGGAYQGWAAGGAGGAGGASGGGGGGGGGGGYAGWYLGSAPGLPLTTADLYIGGAGGQGGSADSGNSVGSGGTGGTGGAGIVGDGYNLTVQAGASATGGRGGDGGSHGGYGGNGGTGGVGGTGADGTGFILVNQGTLTGGAGGTGGSGNNAGGKGGAGLAGASFYATNAGSILGGNGGGGGAGGAGVFATGGATVVNAGSIAGGLGDNGAGTQADAVHFSGGGNTLVLSAGSNLAGNAVSEGGDTLALGGSANGSFDLSSVVASASGGGTQYVGFGALRKTGSSTWVVTGTNATGGGWLLDDGVLSVASSSGAELGPSVAFNGGALSFTNTSPVTYGGNLAVGANGGTINANANQLNYLNNRVTFTGQLSGGSLMLNADPASTRGLIVFNGAAGTQSVDALTALHGLVRIGDGSTATDLAVRDLIVQNNASFSVSSGAVLKVGGGIAIAPAANFSLDGELDVASSASIGAAVAMNRWATISIGAGQTLALQRGFYGEGFLNVGGGGTVLDSGSESGLAGIAIAAGSTFQIGSGGASDAIRLFGGGARNDGTLVWNHADQAMANWDIQGTGALVHEGTGTLTLGGSNTYTGDTVVSGGTLAVNDSGSLGTGALRIAGGAAASLANEAQQLASLGGNGTLTLNRTLLDITGAGTDIFMGSLAGDGTLNYHGGGTLNYHGGGTLVLDGDSRGFAGSTAVTSGALVVGSVAGNGAVLGGNVSVSGDSMLGGHGEIGGNVELLGGAHLAPGHSIGTLAIDGDLHLAQGSVLDYEFGAPGADMHTAGTGDSVHVGGNLTLDGATLNVSDLGMGPGLYNVFTYGGALSESNGGIALGAAPAGRTLLWQNLAAQKQINLIDATGLSLNFWNANGLASSARMGGGGGSWSAESAQWTDAVGGVPNAAMQPRPGFAMFGGTAGTVTVDGSAGAVQATGMQFATDGYAVDGGTLELIGNGVAPVIRVGDGSSAGASMTATIGAVLAGSAGLTKTDAGTLVLAGANIYTGGTAINGGTLSVGSDANLGQSSGGVTFNGGTLKTTGVFATARTLSLAGNGTLQADTDLTVSGAITGGGALTKTGAGTLVLAGGNTYTGGTVIGGGTLSVGSDANLGGVTGAVTFNGGLLKTTCAFATSRTVNMASNGILQTDADLTISGAITGSGTLTKTGAGTLVLAGGNTYTGGTVIGGGTLSVGSDANLGGATGAVTFNGGLLKTTGTFATGRALNLASNGTLQTDADLTVAGAISGSGTLTKTGNGVLALSGSNTYAGGTAINGGTLSVSSDANLGLATGAVTLNGGALATASAFATARTLNLAGNGSLQTDADLTVSGAITGGALTKTGAGTLILAGANSYSGGTTIAAGTLQGDTHTLRGAIIDNGALVFAQSDRGVFDGSLSGHGHLRVQGGGTLVVNGANSFDGDTTVTAGTLVVGDDSHAGATLGGKVAVGTGATLHGIGSIGGLDLAGTVAPGNSIGTLRVNGDAVFQKGATYQLEVQPDGGSDRIVASGKASIQGGNVVVLAQPGSYAARTDYTMLSASQGISGQFDGVSSNLAFLTPSLAYTANAVTLSMQRNDIAMASVATTPNQRAVAGAIDSLGRGRAVYDAVLGMDASHARASYDPLTGELHASTRTALLDDSYYVRDAVNRRLLGQDGIGDRSASRGGVTAWTSAWGRAGQIDGDGNTSRLNADSSGLLVGADVAVSDQAKLGAFGGVGKQALRIVARGDKADVHATHLGIYGGAQWGAWQARAGVAYAWERVDSKRQLGLAGGAASAVARYDADLAHGYVEGGYRFEFGAAALEPYLNVAHMRLRTDAIEEANAAAALDAAGKRTDTTTATLGTRLYVGLDPQGVVHAHAGLGWRQAWGATASSVQERFAVGGSSFTVDGVPMARHAAVVEGGLSWRWSPRVSMDANYQGQFASGNKDQAVRLNLSVAF
jgi:outer membrane autotransporter protein